MVFTSGCSGTEGPEVSDFGPSSHPQCLQCWKPELKSEARIEQPPTECTGNKEEEEMYEKDRTQKREKRMDRIV